MKQSKPLARTGFARAIKGSNPSLSSAPGLLRAAASQIKSRTGRRQRQTKIRASARDQECTLRFPGICNGRTDTTVLCHSNLLADGKGMGLKAPDTRAAYGCCDCHDLLDGRRPRPEYMTREYMLQLADVGIQRTQEILAQKGLLGTFK